MMGTPVMFWLCILVLPLLLLHGYREYWARRDLLKIHSSEFDGELLKVGATYIARRPAQNHCQRTIVCFPGFLEDMRYFQDLYKDNDAELILLNNANYHCPFDTDGVTEVEWPENPYTPGTIEHDAFYLGLTLEHLVRGKEVCLHGHSRGGAVVLDTGRQYHELVSRNERPLRAILEAPVLPQARSAGNASDPIPHLIACYFMPIFFGRMRNVSTERLLKMPMMRPTTPLKTHLCQSIFSVARNYSTCVANVRSIAAWQRTSGYELFRGFPTLSVVVGARDDVLDNTTMLASAKQGQKLNDGVSILQTEDTNHFISLEQPSTIRAIL